MSNMSESNESLGFTIDVMTHSQVDALASIYIITSILSIIGSGSIVAVVIIKKKVCNSEIRPIFHLSLADLIASLGLFIGSVMYLKYGTIVNGRLLCSYITAFSSSFYMNTFIFTALYGYEVYTNMKQKLSSTSRQSLAMFPQVYSLYSMAWLFPFAVTLCLFAIDSGENGKGSLNDDICGTCLPVFHYKTANCTTIRSDNSKHEPDWNSAFKYVFLSVLGTSMVASVVIYFLALNVFRHVQQGGGIMTRLQYTQQTTVRRWACLYQTVFIFCWLPSIVLGIFSLDKDYAMVSYYVLYIIQALVTPMQGFFNCIIYGWRRRGFKEILQQRNYGSMSSSGEHTRTL